MCRARALFVVAVALVTATAATAIARPPAVSDAKDKQIIEGFCRHAADMPRRLSADYCYGPAQQAERLARMNHSWQGGPVANGYIHGKFIEMPQAAAGRPIFAQFGHTFAAKPANRKLLASLHYTVPGRGYQAPATPAEMKPMPKDECP